MLIIYLYINSITCAIKILEVGLTESTTFCVKEMKTKNNKFLRVKIYKICVQNSTIFFFVKSRAK